MKASEVLRRAKQEIQYNRDKHHIGAAFVKAGDEVGMELAAYAFGILAQDLGESIVSYAYSHSHKDIIAAIDRAIALAEEEEAPT